MLLLGLSISLCVWGDPSTVAISDAKVTVTGSSSATLNFSISRGGDTSYPAFVQYRTRDGTALAGRDYTAASGSVVIPAGAATTTIPVTVAGRSNNPPDKTFEMLLLGGDGARSFTPSFGAQRTFATGPYSYLMTVVDVNGDGKPDLIAANGGAVSVLLNTTAPGAATPSFAAPQLFSPVCMTESGSCDFYAITSADLNGDGKPDLILTSQYDPGPDYLAGVLLNTTAPGATTVSFATPQTFGGGEPNPVTVADINGDGKPDLIVPACCTTGGWVLLNTTPPGAATLSFAAAVGFVTFGESGILAADVNGDGRPDLILENYNYTVGVLLNTTPPGAATPSFDGEQDFVVDSSAFCPSLVAVADVNGDGKPDLLVDESNCGDSFRMLAVMLNTTPLGAFTPTFASPQAIYAGEPGSVAVADINGDGKPDLIATVFGPKETTVSVLLNTTAPGAATPSFAAQKTFAAGFYPFFVTVADVNGDGKPDLITANSDNTVSVLLNNTSLSSTTAPGFANHRTFATGSEPHSVTAADLNNDGKRDLIVANEADNTVSVLLNTTPPGAATPSFAARLNFPTGSEPVSVAAADLNGDGKPDLIVANAGDASDSVSVLLNNTPPVGVTTPSFATQEAFATGREPSSVTTADLNGDGKSDLIVTNNGDDTVSVLFNTTVLGATTPSFATQKTFATGFNPTSVAAADVNGDAKPDLIVANGGANTVSVLLNTTAPGATTPSFATQQPFATSFNPTSVAVADVNGDGKADLIVANRSDDTVSVLLNTTAPGAGTPSFAPQKTFATGFSPTSVAVADVDGDGRPDLIVANSNGDTVSLLLNTTAPGATTPSFATQKTFVTGSGPLGVIAADFNGDGAPDLIAANLRNNTVSVLLNTMFAVTTSGSPATGTIHYAVPTVTPAPTPSPGPTHTPTRTRTPTATRTATATQARTPTPTATHAVRQTPTPTRTPAPTT